MPTISLCMIARDEGMNLGNCLASVRKQVDEIIVVDTGSKDNTIQIAKNFGALVILCTPETHPDFFIRDDAQTGAPPPYSDKWLLANFAGARNLGWSVAQSDYQFWVDADDRLWGPENGLREIVEEMHRDSLIVGYLPYWYRLDAKGNSIDTYIRERIVKRGHGYWEGMIHETIQVDKSKPNRNFDKVIVKHYWTPTNRTPHRNYKILRKQLTTEGDRPNPRTLFYLGNESSFNSTEQLMWWDKYLRAGWWHEEKCIARLNMGRIYERQNNYENAFRMFASATYENPSNPDPFFALARLAYYQEKWDKCIEWTEKAAALGNDPTAILWYNERERVYEPHIYYNFALYKVGRVKDALESCNKGLIYAPTNRFLISNKALYEKELSYGRGIRTV